MNKITALFVALLYTFISTSAFSYGGPTVNDRNVQPLYGPKLAKKKFIKVPSDINIEKSILGTIIIDIGPSTNHTSLAIKKGLVKIKAVKIKSHRRHAKSSEPDTNNRPSSQKKVQTARVVKACILEDQTTEVSMGCNDVVCLFLLTKLVTIVLGYVFRSLPNKRGGDETSVHSTKKTAAKYPSNPKHMERVHKDIVFCLEDKHVVERSTDTKRHSVREGTLTKGVNKKDCRGCSNWSRVSNADPGTHP